MQEDFTKRGEFIGFNVHPVRKCCSEEQELDRALWNKTLRAMMQVQDNKY